jgi:L-fuconolactonase
MTFQGAIDAHVHVWDADRGDDILILSTTPSLAEGGERPALRAYLDRAKLQGAIVVQSAPSRAHSNWLRQVARKTPGIVGVVAWIDPNADDAPEQVSDLIEDELVCGVRLMLNRMPQPNEVLTSKALGTLSDLSAIGMALECLAPPDCSPVVSELAQSLPEARIVLDHCGLPPGPGGDLDRWDAALSSLSAFPNVASKFSGLIEPFGVRATIEDIKARALRAVELFGPQRLMAASNFPVCNLGGGAIRWAEMLETLFDGAGLSVDERNALMSGSARNAYPRIVEPVRRTS